jgi:hypothetical protein
MGCASTKNGSMQGTYFVGVAAMRGVREFPMLLHSTQVFINGLYKAGWKTPR